MENWQPIFWLFILQCSGLRIFVHTYYKFVDRFYIPILLPSVTNGNYLSLNRICVIKPPWPQPVYNVDIAMVNVFCLVSNLKGWATKLFWIPKGLE